MKKSLQLYIPKTGSIKLALGDFWLPLRGQLIAVTYFMSDIKVRGQGQCHFVDNNWVETGNCVCVFQCFLKISNFNISAVIV